ncbi:MAG: hypothetical protein WC202_04215 [Desulfobacterales bacterium]
MLSGSQFMAKGRSFFKKKQRICNVAMFLYHGPTLEILFFKIMRAYMFQSADGSASYTFSRNERVTAFEFFCMVREDKNALKEAGVIIRNN